MQSTAGRRPWDAERSRSNASLWIYVGVNALLVLIWAVCTMAGVRVVAKPLPEGFFWPIVPIVVWGAVLLIARRFRARPRTYSEEQIRREMEQLPKAE